jgi:hypothetical protein
MATDDLDNKNTPGKKPDKSIDEDKFTDKDKASEKSVDKGDAGIDEEAGTTPSHMEFAAAVDNSKKENLTPEVLEEESIDE